MMGAHARQGPLRISKVDRAAGWHIGMVALLPRDFGVTRTPGMRARRPALRRIQAVKVIYLMHAKRKMTHLAASTIIINA